ncbi:MAG: hypothetical protein AB7G80_06170 [Dongiaceae bacterium]
MLTYKEGATSLALEPLNDGMVRMYDLSPDAQIPILLGSLDQNTTGATAIAPFGNDFAKAEKLKETLRDFVGSGRSSSGAEVRDENLKSAGPSMVAQYTGLNLGSLIPALGKAGLIKPAAVYGFQALLRQVSSKTKAPSREDMLALANQAVMSRE